MTSCGNTILKLGSRGPCVKTLNELLIARGGLDARSISVMDYFGPPTSFSIREFQTANGLTVDAIVGPQTWKALGESVNAATSPSPGDGGAITPGGTPPPPPPGLIDRMRQGFIAMEPWKKWAVVGGGLVSVLFAAYALSTKKAVSLSGFLEYVNDEPESETARRNEPEKCGRTPTEGTLKNAKDILPEA